MFMKLFFTTQKKKKTQNCTNKQTYEIKSYMKAMKHTEEGFNQNIWFIH